MFSGWDDRLVGFWLIVRPILGLIREKVQDRLRSALENANLHLHLLFRVNTNSVPVYIFVLQVVNELDALRQLYELRRGSHNY
jgi:hypothetical protein